MRSRLDLHESLCEALGSKNVYFSPRSNVKMSYPAIVYSRSNAENVHADNRVYSRRTAYSVTVIDANPDSLIPERVAELPYIRHVNHFVSENLNHDIFTIYI